MSVNVNDYASIISQYLYGSTSAPPNLFSSTLIRDTAPTILEVSRAEYFETGPGRFAKGAMSSLVDQFFRPDEHELNGGPLPALAPGEYSKADLAAIYGNDAFGISFQQYNYADGTDDYAVRTFLWNSTAIELSDNPDLKFVVESDGTRYIQNYSLDIRSDAPENFDFVSGDLIAGITADYSQDRMDLSRIGQTVNFQFSGDAPFVARYDEDDFLAERAAIDDTYMAIPDLVDLLAGVNDMFDDLWNTGVTRFLDTDERPILYGTNGQDFFAGDEPQGNKYSPFENPFFEDFIANGLAFVGGAQADTLSYSQLLSGVQVTFSLAGQSIVIEVARGTASDRAIDIETAVLSRGSDTVTISDQATLDALNGFTFNALYGSTAVDTLDLSGANGPITLPESNGPEFFGFETIIGSDANDVIEQDDPSHTLLQGRGGNDTLFSGGGADTLDGGAGNDTLKGGAGADKLIYTEGTDQLEGGTGNDFYDFSGAVGTEKLASIVFRPGDGNDYINNRSTLNQIVLEGVNSTDVSCVYDYQVTSQYNNGNIRVYEISGTFLLLLDGTGDSICIEGIRGYYEQPSWASEPDWGGFGAGISLVFDDKTVAGSSWQTVFGRPYLDIDSTPIPSQYTTAPADHEAEKSTAPDMNGIPGGLDGTTIFDDGDGGPSSPGPGTPGPDLFLTGSIGGAGNGAYDGGAGTDTISYAEAGETVIVNLATESAVGVDIGQDIVRDIENVTGGNGDDQLTGNAEDNVLDGGAAGSDSIDGGDGSDTAVFSLNHSQYTVTLLTSGAILVSDGIAADTITNVEHFSFADRLIAIDDLTFDDGDETGVIVGTPGDDLLTGTSDDDILRGGLGNDTLEGGAGSDTYRYSAGDGVDTIDDWADPTATDVLELGAGISPGSVTVERGTDDFWDIVLGFGNGDSVTIKGGFFAGSSVIEEVRFADSTVWDVSDMRQIHLDAAATSGSDTINGFIDVNDVIRGGGGNDTIYAFSGNDTIYGDAGDDTIFGGEGDDTIIGGAGSDFMIGDAGSDVFVLNTGDGEDWINDFEVGVDKIDLSAITSITGFSDLTATAAEWVAGSTWLYTDANNYVRLEGVALSSLQANDFIFA